MDFARLTAEIEPALVAAINSARTASGEFTITRCALSLLGVDDTHSTAAVPAEELQQALKAAADTMARSSSRPAPRL